MKRQILCSCCGKKLTWEKAYYHVEEGLMMKRLVCKDCYKELNDVPLAG